MDIKDAVIALHQDLIDTNKDVLGVCNTMKKHITGVNKNFTTVYGSLRTLTILSVACVIFTHIRIKKQEETIKDLNEQITELKNMKGE